MIAENIRFLREEILHLSQSDFAERVGSNRGQIDSYENGRAKPKTEVAVKICKLFSIELSDLYNKKLTKSDILTTSEDQQKASLHELEKELAVLTERLAAMHRQLDDKQKLIEEKERTISILLNKN